MILSSKCSNKFIRWLNDGIDVEMDKNESLVEEKQNEEIFSWKYCWKQLKF